MSMSYLQAAGGLSRSINVGRALKNPNISVQEIKTLQFCLLVFQSQLRGDCSASIRPMYPLITNRLRFISR